MTFVRTESSRRSYRRGLIVAGLALMILGASSGYLSNAVHSYQSTFNILPLNFFKIPSNLRDQTTINGQFHESSGNAVTFMIMSSVQFANFQLKQGNTSLYSIQNVASGSVSYTFTIPDTYYLIFAHGSGTSGTTETVSFQRSYYNLDRFELFSGIFLIGLGAVEVFWGLRPKENKPKS